MNAARRRLLPPAVWLGLALAPAILGAVEPLRVMSVNILEDNGASGSDPNRWIHDSGPHRRDRLLQVIADFGPDLLGVQEALSNQVDDLTASATLADYGHYMVGVDDGVRAGANDGIFYRIDRFLEVDSGVFWLSPTPDVPGSKHPSAARIRIATWMILTDIQAGRDLFVVSTHFDHASATAREFSAQLVRDRVDLLAADDPVIVMGDFNLNPDERSYRIMVGEEDLPGLQLLDSYRELLPAETPDELTRHAFSGNISGDRVDYILHTPSLQATAAEIVRTSYDGGLYPSDHYPVTAIFHHLTPPAKPPPGTALPTLAWTGFEGVTGELGYSASVSSPDGTVEIVGSPVHGGSNALGFTQTAGGPKTFDVDFETLDVESFVFVEVSLWWHAPDLSAFESSDYLKIAVEYRTAEGGFSRTLLNASESRLEANDDWAKISTFLPAGVQQAWLIIDASIAQVDREHLYFDDVLVTGLASRAKMTALDPDEEGNWILTWMSTPGIEYRVLSSGDLRTWPVQLPAHGPVPAVGPTTSLTITPPPGQTRRFFRVVVAP